MRGTRIRMRGSKVTGMVSLLAPGAPDLHSMLNHNAHPSVLMGLAHTGALCLTLGALSYTYNHLN